MSVLHILHLDYNFLCWFIKNTFSCYHCYTHKLISLSVFSKGLNTRNVQLTLHKHSKVYTSMKSNLSILCRISWARLTEIRIYNFRFHHYRKWMFVFLELKHKCKNCFILFYYLISRSLHLSGLLVLVLNSNQHRSSVAKYLKWKSRQLVY